MRELIIKRIGELWDHSPNDNGRWRPCARFIAIQCFGVDPETKHGRRAIGHIVLNSATAISLDASLTDEELVELFEITVARAYQQRG